MEGVVIGIAILAAILAVGYIANVGKNGQLDDAPRGAVRVESVKAGSVNRTVNQYARRGWKVTAQTSAKSFGSQARVTLTFQKGS